MPFSAEHLTFGFPGERLLFDRLDWKLDEGEVFCVLGPGGEGKSVFLRLLVGLLHPGGGDVRYRGRDIAEFSRTEKREFYRSIGFAFQRNGLFDSLSCGDNLRFPLTELLGLDSKEREERVKRSLADVGLSGQENLALGEMSGGMQKRLGMARALALNPKVILYDEPTAGLDPLTSVQIHELILEARKKYGMTVVVSTTDPVQAMRLADRIGFLYRGRFVAVETPEKLRRSEHPAVEQFLKGEAEGPLAEGHP